jgi:hypothetical protein
MATVLLLTATYIKDYTFVDPNVDEKYIRISIEEAQKIHIRNYIGSGLYDEIITQVQTNSLTALNTTLLDNYIIPALKWWTMVEAAPFLTYKVTNKNIVRKNSDNSSGVDFNELNSFMNLVTDKAEYHTKRLINYLLQNEASYPLYNNPGSGFDTIFPQGYSYDCNIFLGRNPNYFTYEEKFEKRKRY